MYTFNFSENNFSSLLHGKCLQNSFAILLYDFLRVAIPCDSFDCSSTGRERRNQFSQRNQMNHRNQWNSIPMCCGTYRNNTGYFTLGYWFLFVYSVQKSFRTRIWHLGIKNTRTSTRFNQNDCSENHTSHFHYNQFVAIVCNAPSEIFVRDADVSSSMQIHFPLRSILQHYADPFQWQIFTNQICHMAHIIEMEYSRFQQLHEHYLAFARLPCDLVLNMIMQISSTPDVAQPNPYVENFTWKVEGGRCFVKFFTLDVALLCCGMIGYVLIMVDFLPTEFLRYVYGVCRLKIRACAPIPIPLLFVVRVVIYLVYRIRYDMTRKLAIFLTSRKILTSGNL